MARTVNTYSLRGFLRTLMFSLLVAGVSGVVVFLSAPETINCERMAGSGVDCTLTRSLLGRYPLKTTTFDGVRQVKIDEYKEIASISRNRRRPGTSYRLEFASAGAIGHSVHSGYGELDSVRASVEQMVADAKQQEFEATLTGSPRAHRWSLGFVAFGISVMVLWVLGYFFPVLRPRR